jgi:hypothetical protein
MAGIVAGLRQPPVVELSFSEASTPLSAGRTPGASLALILFLAQTGAPIAAWITVSLCLLPRVCDSVSNWSRRSRFILR